MDLNLSNRGLFSFDAAQARQSLLKAAPHAQRAAGASTSVLDHALTLAAAAPSPGGVAAALPVIRQLNLSYNSLHLFTGGETLRGLTVLDLSHNELTQLCGHALPTTLVQLNLSYNRLTQFPQLAESTPRLQHLDISHNRLSDEGETENASRSLPTSLTQLITEANALESLTPFRHLLHLVKLNVSHNCVASVEALHALRPLLSLRFLDLRGNPVCGDAASAAGASAGSAAAAAAAAVRAGAKDTSSSSVHTHGSRSRTSSLDRLSTRRPHQESLMAVLNKVVPRLSHLNGAALSQAPENRRFKTQQKMHTDSERRHDRSASDKRKDASADRSYASTSRSEAATARPAMEVRLMQAKVSELRRLLLAAQDEEGKARRERALLTENVKSTALVIDQQGAELEKLQEAMAQLREEEQQLRVPMAAAEESFEQVHASLLATKAKASAAALK